MSDNTFIKDVDAELDFAFDWNDADEPWLETGETISSYTLTVPAGITNTADSQASGKVTVWLSGGTDGTWYDITCKIVTSLGRTDERTMHIKVVER